MSPKLLYVIRIIYGICDRTYYNCMCLQDVKIQRYKLYEKNYGRVRISVNVILFFFSLKIDI